MGSEMCIRDRGNIILKKEKLTKGNVEEAHESQQDFKKAASTTS